jgi:deoxyribonuclease IV
MTLRFGPAGFPLSTQPRKVDNAIPEVKKLGLGSMEMEFVQSVWLTKEAAPRIRELAKKEDVILTAHGSYYINLFAKEPEKRGASRTRIIEAATRTAEAGGYSVTFHPAFYLGESSEKVGAAVLEQLKKIEKELKDRSVKIWVRPETTGKPTQFGTYQEILKLSEELEMCMPCIDFSHLHARTNGKYNTKAEFDSVLEAVEKTLGKEGLKNMHIHTSGIAYGEKGEKHHLLLKESDLRYEELCKSWKDFKIEGVVQCESPNLEGDALLLKKTWEKA